MERARTEILPGRRPRPNLHEFKRQAVTQAAGQGNPEEHDTWLMRKNRVRDKALSVESHLWRDVGRNRRALERIYRQVVANEHDLTHAEKDRLLQEMLQDTFGWGLIEPLMQDPQVTEIIIDSPTSVGCIRNGVWQWYTTDFPDTQGPRVTFESDQALEDWLRRLIRHSERELTLSSPLLDDDLRDGARLQATAPPITAHLAVNIRKSVAQTKRYTPDDYIREKIWSADMATFLLTAVRGYANIIVCGPTGIGKTTFIRILMENGIPDTDRVILIEDIRETQAQHPRFLSMQVVKRKSNPITFDDIFAATMRKTPTRVMVSELREPPETVAFLKALSSGHPGSITSQHGTKPSVVLNMLTARAIQGGFGTIPEITRELVYSLVELMVFYELIPNVGRRITQVVEVVPVDAQDKYGRFRTLFRWDKATDTHEWVADPLPEHTENWELGNRVRLPRRPVQEVDPHVALDRQS